MKSAALELHKILKITYGDATLWQELANIQEVLGDYKVRWKQKRNLQNKKEILKIKMESLKWRKIHWFYVINSLNLYSCLWEDYLSLSKVEWCEDILSLSKVEWCGAVWCDATFLLYMIG